MEQIIKLHEFLEQTFAPSEGSKGSNWCDQIRGALTEIIKGEQISHFLEAVLKDQELLAEVAARSYTHFNGFDKVVLLESVESRYKLRLHVWWPETVRKKNSSIENIHNHRWDFGSVLLAGAYRFQEFQLAPDSREVYQHYRYLPPEGKAQYSMKYLGEARLACVFDGLMPQGASYTISRSLHHRVISDRNALAATLMLHGPTGDDDVDVYSDVKIGNSDSIDAIPLSPTSLRQKLKRLLVELE